MLPSEVAGQGDRSSPEEAVVPFSLYLARSVAALSPFGAPLFDKLEQSLR